MEHVSPLPPIPDKRYFTIGEVAALCALKTHVLRYWEQEFAELQEVMRRGNRRYYQREEVLLVRRIRELLYERGYTISGARNQLQAQAQSEGREHKGAVLRKAAAQASPALSPAVSTAAPELAAHFESLSPEMAEPLRAQLLDIRRLLG